MNNHKEKVYKLIAVAVALVVWQLAALFVKHRILLVGPVEVLLRLGTIWQEEGFATAIANTMGRIVLGFLIGYLIGSLLAVLAYKWRWVEIMLWPWVVTVKSVPVASFVVICLIWLSTRWLSVFISFLIVFPIVYQNILTALRGMNRELIDLSRLENMSYMKRVRQIYLPQIAQTIISTAGLTAGMAWKAGVAAEIIGTPSASIGKELYLSKIYLDTDDLLAWTVIIVLLSVACEKLLVFILRRILPQDGDEDAKGAGKAAV